MRVVCFYLYSNFISHFPHKLEFTPGWDGLRGREAMSAETGLFQFM